MFYYIIYIPMDIAPVIAKVLRPKAVAFEKATHNPRSAQEVVLFSYLNRNKNTEYGIKYDFSSIKSVGEYQRSVPLADCETLRAPIERMARGEHAQASR